MNNKFWLCYRLALTLQLCWPVNWQASGQCFTRNDHHSPVKSFDHSSMTEFGLDLYKDLLSKEGTDKNFFMSPYSVWSALALSYLGSEGETEKQLKKVMRLDDKLVTLKTWRALEYLYKMRQISKPDSTSFNIFNRVYFDRSVALKNCSYQILKNELQKLDFSQTATASDIINDMISRETQGRIIDLVSPALLRDARMVLVNAAAFKASWKVPFDPALTKKEVFYGVNDKYSLIHMMKQTGYFKIGVSDELGAHILEIPYSMKDISMYILLPPYLAGEKGFRFLVEQLSAANLEKAMKNTYMAMVQMSLPKFELQQEIDEQLIMTLQLMGIRDLFDYRKANLSGFSPYGDLHLSRGIHKAFVSVNEEGTEAAAATVFSSMRSARPASPDKFIANHPFVFLIFDNLTRNVLFAGAFTNAKSTK